MSWIKEFRLTYGLSQFQLAQFVGITTPYFSVLESRGRVPSRIKDLLLELRKEFEQAQQELNPSDSFHFPIRKDSIPSNLVLRLEKKEDLLDRLQKELASLEQRHSRVILLQKVCQRWKDKKAASDPEVHIKLGSLESGQMVEAIQCGPGPQSKIRVKIARLKSEIRTLKEELEKYFPNQNPLSVPKNSP